ncbi:lysine transporter LysE [Methylobacterium sp. Leaf111]|uniref:LysE family translocator n=1 Tax=Methylobacterium sp. Leaf111 TaxID=1736257 RepID=UPI0006F6D9D6|nr:LysE family translocator [Methylobacterium sp. Leaf111]KQP72665.1 lysine transporter LysE [Methylobacterium sp. Leaf111]
MPLSSLLLSALIYAGAVASPGPGIAALVARVMTSGTRGILGFVLGMIVGDLTWFTIAACGFALLAQAFAPVFVALKAGGVLYLVYLAWKTWNAPVDTTAPAASPRQDAVRAFLGGLTMTLGNPKVILFFLALLPSVVDLPHLSTLGLMTMAAALVSVLGTMLGLYVLAADRARRAFTSRRARRRINQGSATVMAGAAAAIALR